jgi:hypothetical protein
MPITLVSRSYKLLFTLFISVVLIACGGGSGDTNSSANNSPVYTMIFDAGSSGTRVNFYKVIPGNGGYPKVTLLDNQKFKDNGINDFLNGTGTINTSSWTANASTGLPSGYSAPGCTMTSSSKNGGESDVSPCVIQPLLDSMAGAMTAAGVTASQVKVELFATAGMRTMSIFNGGNKTDSQIASFYQTMKDYTQTNKGFVVGDFATSNGNSQEGLWTWVNLNDQYYNAFGGNTTYYTGTPTTRGDFEVGGSSMQVAFPTSSITPGDANNVYTVSINSRTYNVFSKTYLGLGGDDARKFMRSYYYSSGGPGYTGIDCFGSNANSTNTEEDSGVSLFYASFFPLVTTPGSGNPTGVTWPTYVSNVLGSTPTTPLVMGASGNYNLSTCSDKYNNVTANVMTLPRNNYGTLNQGTSASYSDFITKVGASSAPFVGLDGFYYASRDLGLVSSGQLKTNFTRAQFTSALSSTCPDGGAGPSPDPVDPSLFDVSVCANAAYMSNFLWQFSGSGGLFSSGTNASFEGVVPSDVGKTAVLTWTRGYLLLKYAN